MALRARVGTEIRRDQSVSIPEAKTLITAFLDRIMVFVPEDERERALAQVEGLLGEMSPENALRNAKIEVHLGSESASTFADLVRRVNENSSDRDDIFSPDQLGEVLAGLDSLGAFDAKGGDSEPAAR